MASAILPSRNEARSSDFRSNFTNNGSLNFNRFQNVRSPNPNSSHFFIGNTSRDVRWKNHELVPSSAPPEAAFTSTSVIPVPANSYGYRYITYRVGSYTRRELKELKRRLISDLERVRVLRHWISCAPIPKKKNHPPQLELPTAPEVALTGNELPKSVVGQKRTKPCAAVRETKKQCGRVKNNAQRNKLVMRKCGQILGKLMKHKHGWVFNTPVDAVALKLLDYHNIINNPMDLGTIKSKLSKNEYESPAAFATDVRLTFQNAMVYNGKGSDVFAMAERLLLLFEDMFSPPNQKSIGTQPKKQNRFAKVPIPMEKPVSILTPSNPIAPPAASNLGKSMVREAIKPEMTGQEKSELADSLLNLQLGPEGTDQMMAIINKGVMGLQHVGDEIELDLGVLDNDTLWELHRLISTSRQQAAATSSMRGIVTELVSSVQTDISPAGEALFLEEEFRKKDGGDEDIDIGEEMQLTNYPSLEIQKDAVNASSSGGSSSSSSGSDSSSGSGSSSCSGDDEQEANSTPNFVSMVM